MRSLPERLQTIVGLGLAGIALLFAGGCATPGPLHVYSVATLQPTLIHDTSGDAVADVPSFLATGENLTGLAYDPFTDHFFLRLAPGNRIRVVDRPARRVKREFAVAELSTAGGGDLAVRPRNGHLFLSHATEPKVLELTRLGKWVRAIPLEGTTVPPLGVAYDAAQDRLLVLTQTAPGRIAFFDFDGRPHGGVTLERNVAPSLAFDAGPGEFYAPLAEGRGEIGIFDPTGRLRRTLPMRANFLDVGPRSFLRMF